MSRPDLSISQDLAPVVEGDLAEREAWWEVFFKLPNATITLVEYSRLDQTDKIAAVRAGARVEAERLMKLSQAVQGGIPLADAISEVDGGQLRDTLRLQHFTEKAARRLGADPA